LDSCRQTRQDGLFPAALGLRGTDNHRPLRILRPYLPTYLLSNLLSPSLRCHHRGPPYLWCFPRCTEPKDIVRSATSRALSATIRPVAPSSRRLFPSACCTQPPRSALLAPSASRFPSPLHQPQNQRAPERVGLDISAPGDGGISVLRSASVGKPQAQRSRTARTGRYLPPDTRRASLPPQLLCIFGLLVAGHNNPGTSHADLLSRAASPWDPRTYTARHPVSVL
jgi:hypothetical protein